MAADGPTILFAGGGTGEHVYPGLALARALEDLRPGATIRWVGTKDRVEARAVPRAGYALDTLEVAWLKGRRGLALARAAASLPGAGVAALRLVRRIRPDVVIGLGGFVSGPVGLAAAAQRIPVVLLEQNARPGVTNRALARVATRVYASFEASKTWFPAGRVVVAGNPVRRELIEAMQGHARRPGPPRLLVFGGSQGARSINDNAPRIAAAIRDGGLDIEVRHATGRGAEDRVAALYEEAGVSARVDGYIDDMASAYQDADMALCRAGATTIAELTAIGLPALYVPFPHAADDHQTANARAIVEAGGGVMVRDDEMGGERPSRLLGSLLGMPEVLVRMRAAARALGRPNAASEIASDLVDLVGM